MFDKLFVRVRSWLHADPQPAAAGGTGLVASDYVGASPNRTKAPPKGPAKPVSARSSAKPAMTPPPLPPDAWMESESGMVITESGIIIIDPALAESQVSAPPPPPRGVPADTAWALPTLPRNGSAPARHTPAPPHRISEDLDWDEVLARARANIAAATPAPTRSTPAPAPAAVTVAPTPAPAKAPARANPAASSTTTAKASVRAAATPAPVASRADKLIDKGEKPRKAEKLGPSRSPRSNRHK